MNFIGNMSNDIFRFGAIILGGLAAFFTFRSHYISKGEERAKSREKELTLGRILKAKEAEINFKGVRGEKIDITGYGDPDDFVWSKDAISFK